MVKIKKKRNCKEAAGEADLENNTIFLCGNLKGNERKHVIKHEKAHLDFNKILQKKPKKVKKYAERVLDSPPLSDDLEKMKRSTPSQRGAYIDEYFAQTKEIQSRINAGNKNLNSKEFKIAKKNLRSLN